MSVLIAVALLALAPQDPAAASGDAEAALVARARAIHERVITLDTHKDISSLLAKEPPSDPATRERFRRAYDPSVDGDRQVDFPKMRRGGLDCAFFIVYVGQRRNDPAGFAAAKRAAFDKFDAIDRMCARFPDDIALARSPDDVVRIARSGKLVACIGIENGYAMGEDLSLIAEFQRRGARYMSIAHNRHSQLGDSHTPDEPLHGGLSALGREAVLELNRVGILVDVSHGSRATMLQVLEVTKAPVIASHSSCRALCDHSRNLDDEQLRALAKNGGVVQIVALDEYVKDARLRRAEVEHIREDLGLPPEREWVRLLESAGDEAGALREKMNAYHDRVSGLPRALRPADVSDLVDHVDHAVAVCGIDHVGLSTDFDGGGGIEGWHDASETFNVTLELVRRGYTEEQITKIWSGNTLRLWRDAERVARELAGH